MVLRYRGTAKIELVALKPNFNPKHKLTLMP